MRIYHEGRWQARRQHTVAAAHTSTHISRSREWSRTLKAAAAAPAPSFFVVADEAANELELDGHLQEHGIIIDLRQQEWQQPQWQQ